MSSTHSTNTSDLCKALLYPRSVALVGRSMRRMVAAAQATGYLKGLPSFVNEEEAGQERPAML